ncbi:5360_t:CDS:2, partial [Racocetra persica]
GNKQIALEYLDKFSEIGDAKRIQKEAAHLFERTSDVNITDAHTKYGDCLLNDLARIEEDKGGAHYLKLAAWENYKKAIDCCKKYEINWQLT